MASKIKLSLLAFLSLKSIFKVSQAVTYSYGFSDYNSLSPYFYDFSCPQANDIVVLVLENAIAQDARVATSLLRLHFHDNFVQGCDSFILVDDNTTFVSEKRAKPNANSLRRFTVIDEVKARLEEACPETVSCGDILALVACAASVLSGGPDWELPLERRDSKKENMLLQMQLSLPLSLLPKSLLHHSHNKALTKLILSQYQEHILNLGGRGLLFTDQQLYSGNNAGLAQSVKSYAEDKALFFDHFSKSMVKMRIISPLLGSNGEVRRNCRRPN